MVLKTIYLPFSLWLLWSRPILNALSEEPFDHRGQSLGDTFSCLKTRNIAGQDVVCDSSPQKLRCNWRSLQNHGIALTRNHCILELVLTDSLPPIFSRHPLGIFDCFFFFYLKIILRTCKFFFLRLFQPISLDFGFFLFFLLYLLLIKSECELEINPNLIIIIPQSNQQRVVL